MNGTVIEFNQTLKNIAAWLILSIILVLTFQSYVVKYEPRLYDAIKDAGILLCVLILIFSYISNSMNNVYVKFHFFFLLLLYIFLISESIMEYGKILEYPHVILFLSYVLYTAATYALLSKKTDPWYFVRRLTLIGSAIIYLLVLTRNFTILSILEIERATHASMAYFLLAAALFFIVDYFRHGKMISLVLIFINLFIILIEQHRSVWVCTIFSTSLFIGFAYMTKSIDFKNRSVLIIIIMLFTIFTLFAYLIFFHGDQYIRTVNFMKYRFEEIFLFKEQGSGAWRYAQYQYYIPYIKNNILFGMRFRGFEIPPLYEFVPGELSGHHLHSGYLAVMLYHGLLGLYLIYGLFVYYMVRFLKIAKHSLESMAMFSFLSSTFIYSFAYMTPEFSFALLGLALVRLEQESENQLT